MESWQLCKASFVKMELMHLLVRNLTSMDPPQPINGLNAGGHFSEEEEQAGGLIFQGYGGFWTA